MIDMSVFNLRNQVPLLYLLTADSFGVLTWYMSKNSEKQENQTLYLHSRICIKHSNHSSYHSRQSLQWNNYSVFQKSDAKIEITITATNLIRIKYPLSIFNYHLSGANVANLNKIHCTVFEQQLFNKKLIRRWDSERELSLRRHCTRTKIQ